MSKRSITKKLDQIKEAYWKRTGVLLASRLHTAEPHHLISSPDFRLSLHVKEIFYYCVFGKVDLDSSIWPPKNINAIIEECVQEYIKKYLTRSFF